MNTYRYSLLLIFLFAYVFLGAFFMNGCASVTVKKCQTMGDCLAQESCIAGICQGKGERSIQGSELNAREKQIQDAGGRESSGLESKSSTKVTDWSQKRNKPTQVRSFPLQGMAMHILEKGWIVRTGSACKFLEPYGSLCTLQWRDEKGSQVREESALGGGLWLPKSGHLALVEKQSPFCQGESPWSEDHFKGSVSILALEQEKRNVIWSKSNMIFSGSVFPVIGGRFVNVVENKPRIDESSGKCGKTGGDEKTYLIHLSSGKELFALLTSLTPSQYTLMNNLGGGLGVHGAVATFLHSQNPQKRRYIWLKMDGTHKVIFEHNSSLSKQVKIIHSAWAYITTRRNATKTKEGELTLFAYHFRTGENNTSVLPIPVGAHFTREYGRWFSVCKWINDLRGSSQECTLYDVLKKYPHWSYKQTDGKEYVVDDIGHQVFLHDRIANTIERINLQNGNTKILFSNTNALPLNSSHIKLLVGNEHHIFFLAKDTLFQLTPIHRKISIPGLLEAKYEQDSIKGEPYLFLFAKGSYHNLRTLYAWQFQKGELFKLSTQAYKPRSSGTLFCGEPGVVLQKNAFYFSEVSPDTKDELDVFVVPFDLSSPPIQLFRQKAEHCLKPIVSVSRKWVSWSTYTNFDSNQSASKMTGKIHVAKLPSF